MAGSGAMGWGCFSGSWGNSFSVGILVSTAVPCECVIVCVWGGDVMVCGCGVGGKLGGRCIAQAYNDMHCVRDFQSKMTVFHLYLLCWCREVGESQLGRGLQNGRRGSGSPHGSGCRFEGWGHGAGTNWAHRLKRETIVTEVTSS